MARDTSRQKAGAGASAGVVKKLRIVVSLDEENPEIIPSREITEDESRVAPSESQTSVCTKSTLRQKTVVMSEASTRLPSAYDPMGIRSGKTVVETHGEVNERYEKLDMLGSGTFGTVYVVKKREGGEKFALKTILSESIGSPKLFAQELKIAKKLQHPNIVKLHEAINSAMAFHLVMDLCVGKDLSAALEETVFHFAGRMMGGFQPWRISQLLWQMLAGVAYIHNYNISHRDIKLENYLLETENQDSNMKLIDFGLARSFRGDTPMTTRCGTVQYMAPQVIAGSYGAKCDEWSIGITAYAMCTATFPFTSFGDDEQRTLERIKAGDFTFEHDGMSMIPKELQKVIRSLITLDEAARPHARDIMDTNEWLKAHHDGKQDQPSCCSLQ